VSSLKKLKSATNIKDLSALLGYRPDALAFILYKLDPSEKYERFQIPKKNGGVRDICAPTAQLKLLQRRLANLLYACRAEIDRESGLASLSHGFRRGHSIVTNAKPHQRRRYVFNLDLKDFFPTFNFGRVRGFFIKNRAFALNDKVATLIAQIACYDNQLPQGSPCSPVIADLITHLLDVRLAQLAKKERITYSRYADDITFSTNQKTFPEAVAIQDPIVAGKWDLGPDLAKRIKDTYFTVKPEKTRMQCGMSRKIVTGLTVNQKVNVQSDYYRFTRAMCDALFKRGEYWIDHPRALLKPAVEVVTKSEAVEMVPEIATTSLSHKSLTKSLGPLTGRLAHIHYVKNEIDPRDEIKKRKLKTAFRNLYFKFLFYKNFVTLDKPLIITEGKTDNVYLSLAIKYSPEFQPKLGYMTSDGFVNKLRLFNHHNKTRSVLELNGGSGNFKSLIKDYNKHMLGFGHRPQLHPVIILLDNDDGATKLFLCIKENYKKNITVESKENFYHITDNLYVVKTPHVGKQIKTCIEDMFDHAIRVKQLNGKTFNPNKLDITKEFGKHIFAERIIRPEAASLNWTGFAPILESINAVLEHYSPPN
jgi:hypothetical protein